MRELEAIECEIYLCDKNYLTIKMNGLDVLKINPETGVALYSDENCLKIDGEYKIDMDKVRKNERA